jgi:uncharacterized protein
MAGSASDSFVIGGHRVRLGESKDIALKVSETVMGVAVIVPVRVERGPRPGPTVFVTGAVHGDELNGTGIIRELMFSNLSLDRGTLLLVPVVNVFGFERHTRYLPDRRDLNRSFPGDPKGSLAFRLAHVLFRELIERSDFGIDLHTAGQGRTNFPHSPAGSDPRWSWIAAGTNIRCVTWPRHAAVSPSTWRRARRSRSNLLRFTSACVAC